MKVKQLNTDSLLTSHQAGKLLQVNPSSINKWVKDGHIPAFRTPGGHHRIRALDLVTFLDAHQMPIPKELENAGRRRLMIVDDDTMQLKSIERLLRPYEDVLDIRLVENGIDALILAGSFKPHAMLLDYIMPNLDGIEVCRRLKTVDETSHIKVVVLTAKLTDQVKQDATEAGAALCIHKPLEIITLLELLAIEKRAAA